jgi:hypothetical protein
MIRAESPAVLFDNGTWYMCYEADDAANVGRRRIGLATATNPMGPWTRRGIALEGTGGWEGSLVGTPAICKIGSRYYLFYHGYSGGADRGGVAYATSPFGPWTREPNNPILPLGSGWDCCKTAPSSVITYGDGRVMVFYEGWGGGSQQIANWQSGIADGQVDPATGRIMSLTKRTADPPNPCIRFGPSGSYDSSICQLPSALIVGNQVWCYYSAQGGGGFSLALATANIS